jgi:IclR family acetate operon transcriptional repressor
MFNSVEQSIPMAGTKLVDEFEKSPVLKAMRLLAQLANSTSPVSLADLSRTLDLPKSTSHRLAHMLERAGFVHKDPLTSHYSLGSTFEELALSALRNGVGSKVRRELMDELSAKLGVCTNFAVLKAGKVLHVEWVESSMVLRVDLKPETRVPVHCSASGKLLLALGPEGIRDTVLSAAPFEALTEHTITSAKDLKEELEEIRRQGYAEDDEEFLPGVCCMAVPVKNRDGKIVAGLAMMAPKASFPLTKARQHLSDFRACADAISAELGAGSLSNSHAN